MEHEEIEMQLFLLVRNASTPRSESVSCRTVIASETVCVVQRLREDV
jgi:hypothetical protein